MLLRDGLVLLVQGFTFEPVLTSATINFPSHNNDIQTVNQQFYTIYILVLVISVISMDFFQVQLGGTTTCGFLERKMLGVGMVPGIGLSHGNLYDP